MGEWLGQVIRPLDCLPSRYWWRLAARSAPGGQRQEAGLPHDACLKDFMKLYTVPLAPNPMRVTLYLAERAALGAEIP